MFKKFLFLSMVSFQAFSAGSSDPISVTLTNISKDNVPGISFSIDRKIDIQKGKRRVLKTKSSGLGFVAGEVVDEYCEDCSLNQYGYDVFVGKNVTTTFYQAKSLVSFVTEHDQTPFAIRDHGAGLSLSLLEGFYYGGLKIGNKHFRAIMMVGAGGRIEIGTRNGIVEVGGGVIMRLESEKLGLRLEGFNRGSWSVFTNFGVSESRGTLSNNPTLTIHQKGHILRKIKVAIEGKTEYINSNDQSIRSDYGGVAVGFKF